MFYYILAFVLGAIISGLIVYILKEQQLKQLEIEAMQAVQAAYDRGRADAQQAEEPGLGEILNGVGSVATIIGLLG